MTPTKTKPSAKVASLLHKFDHAATGEFSAHVTPEESELVARIVRDYYERLNASSLMA